MLMSPDILSLPLAEPVKRLPRVIVSPLYDFQVLGGQNFYTGENSSLSMDANGFVAPAIKFNDEWSLLPSFVTAYNGTRQVVDIVGGGTAFQSQWDNEAAVKAIYSPDGSKWRLKPYSDFKYEFLQQSTQEQLGQGLYDYYQWDAGMSAEYVYHDPFSIRFGADYYAVHFPNYTSLESEAATQFQGQSLARELVGNYILDSQNALLTVSADAPVKGKFIVEGQAGLLYANYPQQHLVNESGSLDSPVRTDVTSILGASVKYPHQIESGVREVISFGLNYLYDSSNQNSFDATQSQYIPFFYNYGQLTVTPGFELLVGPDKNPVDWSVSASWWYDRYPHRPIQSADGTYLGQALYTNNWMIQSSLNYPMAPHFSLVFSAQYGRGTSNDRFQQFYQYAFTTGTYMFGVSYDY